MPRGDGSFRVLSKINDNDYKIEFPEHYGVSTSFNVADLTPFFGLEESESRITPCQEGRMMRTSQPYMLAQVLVIHQPT
jgi:predicted NUDIX family NTP pyrophosphohydrolase